MISNKLHHVATSLSQRSFNSSMLSRKRALLIGSPFGDLRGPLNDAELMTTVLEEQGFEVVKCCGTQATSDNIRSKWRHLINQSSAGDAVVIYYSGHGGIADCGRGTLAANGDYNDTRPWRYQFIVPMDFDQASEGRDFRGILDIELSQLLNTTTEKTKNVTLILDCCHSGRMARQPGYGDQARPKSLARVYHHDISKYIEQCRNQGRLLKETHLEGNPHAVRITAAATTESAFEYTNPAGKVYGAMTEILTSAIREGYGQEVSWRTTLMRVRESVNVNFPQQHPCAEGPDTRLHFSTKQLDPSRTRDFVLKVEAGRPVLRAGRIAGVHKGNTYAIMPLDSKDTGEVNKIADAVVTNVYSSYSELDLNPAGSISMIPIEGSMACLQHEALPRWPVMLSAELDDFRPTLADSRFLRCSDATQEDLDPPLMTIRKDADQILLSTNREVDIATVATREEAAPSQEEFLQIVKKAEHLARAQHLLSIQNGHETALQHKVVMDVGWVTDGRPGENRLEHNGDGCLTEDDRIFIKLANRGHSTVYVSVFDINVVGTISLISASSPEGIELEAGRTYTLGKNQYDESHRGLKISWPKDVPKSPGVNEWLVFVFSSSSADLRHLVNPVTPRSSKLGPLSRLEKLVDWISFGNKRDIEEETEEGVRFTVSQLPFLLKPQTISANALPTPDNSAEWMDSSHDQHMSRANSKVGC
jgi:hypothetical protein